jgi:hypothetical protein
LGSIPSLLWIVTWFHSICVIFCTWTSIREAQAECMHRILIYLTSLLINYWNSLFNYLWEFLYKCPSRKTVQNDACDFASLGHGRQD